MDLDFTTARRSTGGGLDFRGAPRSNAGVSDSRKRGKSAPVFKGSGGLGFDPRKAVRTLRGADPVLARLIDRTGRLGLQLESISSPYEALAEAILYQQLSGKAAATIVGRLKALYGSRRFPRPEEILGTPLEDLRKVGVSRAKAAALHDLAAKTRDGEVPTLVQIRRLSDEEIVSRLDPIRGVGRWTVEMLLIFALGRPDVLPVHDYGVRKGFARAFRMRELPTPAQVALRGERWRPFRTAATWYLWRALEP
jgi:3-methyladenine DNA glycosylase/8-oxoguanine DNA glycosylase